MIRRGSADVMITGGSEAGISQLGLAGFAVMRALTSRNDDPGLASRPFDADRDGEVTQREYMSRRLRGPSNSGIRDRRHFTRMRSNFRAADRDRNGRLSKKELRAIRNPRF